MINAADQVFLRRALRLAMNGRGYTEPNPSVGCVLVKNGQTIGEGWTQPFGGAHAEPTALADCKTRGNDPAGATAYVTLEPCSHTNKKTPPCAPRLIEAKIARVVIGCLDPNPDVNGNGVAMLRAAGVEVDTRFSPADRAAGEESELTVSHFRQLIAPFILQQRGERPYITLKWAETADQKIGLSGRRPLQISNPLSSRIVHELRGRCDAIAVGVSTAIVDDPMLTARDSNPPRRPTRIVIDPRLILPLTHQLVLSAKEIPVICYCLEQTLEETDKVKRLEAFGVEVVGVPPKATVSSHLGLDEVVRDWAKRRFTQVLVEPGTSLARSMALTLTDRIWIFRSTRVLDDAAAPASFPITRDGPYLAAASLNLAGDTLTEYLNTKSPAFFAATPSADFVLATESAHSVA